MSQYFLYIAISALTIASPGPGVLLTLSNSLNYNFREALAGITGITVGMGWIALIAASSLGVIISSSPATMNIVRIIGALYLAYLGVKLLRSKPKINTTGIIYKDSPPSWLSRFKQGMFVSIFNPKPIIFFMALFPQFLESNKPFISQFTLLALTFCALVFMIHCLYAYAAHALINNSARSGFVAINRVGGIAFMGFSLVLIYSVCLSFFTGN